MHRFEHRHLLADVDGARDAHRSRDLRCDVRQNVAVEVQGDDDIEVLWAGGHPGGTNVDDLVVYPATGTTNAVLNVFTDTSCPYCKKLHEEVPELQKAGIEVRYFPFPRGGNRGPGYDQLRKVWCGADRLKTMDIIKGVDTGDLPTGNCAKAAIVDRGYELGNVIGVSGTPALFTESGQKIEGYVPYAQLIPMLLSTN